MLMTRDDATLLIVDVQEKLYPALFNHADLSTRLAWLIGAAHEVGLPIVFTEQYPQGLGNTLPELRAQAASAPVIEKIFFSCVPEDKIDKPLRNREQVIVAGAETHICVLQTVLELLDQDKSVFVVADACGSRRESNHEVALLRMRDAGAMIVTREMVIYELLRRAGTDTFKALSKKYFVGEQP